MCKLQIKSSESLGQRLGGILAAALLAVAAGAEEAKPASP